MPTRLDAEAGRLEDLKLRTDLAAIRFQAALVRLEMKYRADQLRKPKGPGGGQFAEEGGSPMGMLSAMAARTGADIVRGATDAMHAISNVESGVMALPGATYPGSAAGVLATPGAARASQGVLVATPFGLPIPAPLPEMQAPTLLRDTGAGREPVPKGKFDDECDEQFEQDSRRCQLDSALYGRTKQEKKELFGICAATAEQRRAECLTSGPEGIKTPLFDARLDHARNAAPPPKRSQKPGKYNKPIPRGVSLLNFRREKPQ